MIGMSCFRHGLCSNQLQRWYPNRVSWLKTVAALLSA